MTRKILTALALTCLVASVVVPAWAADEATTIHTVLEHYEAVRTVLVMDTVDDSADHARAIEEGLAVLHTDIRANFDAKAAAVEPGSTDKALDLLGKMHVAATSLAQATQAGDLDATREAFYELSKPMVQYRELMTGERPVVAYCPMEKKSWLQAEDAIGNPYAGQSMPTCGSVVSGGSSGGQ